MSFLNSVRVLAVLALLLLAPNPSLKAESTVEQISPGTYVTGAQLNVPSLKGKVVVLEYWGLKCPPCRSLYPHLVSLAKTHKGKPLHIITSHCQGGSIDEIKSFVMSQGVVGDEPNLSVVNQSRHSLIQSNGIPYYGIFNHKGEMVHAGSPADMDSWVEKLLADTPNLFAGEEPYTKIDELAKQVETGKGLGPILARLEGILKGDAIEEGRKPLSATDIALSNDTVAKAECQRLHDVLTGYADIKKTTALSMVSTNPSNVIPELASLEKELSGTAYVAEKLVPEIESMKASAELKDAIAIDRDSKSILKSAERLKSCKACMQTGSKFMKSGCAGCKAINQKKLEEITAKLEALIEGKEIPIAQRLRDSISGYKS